MDLRFCLEREASTAGKCSQPQIVNVKWGEQANALTDHGLQFGRKQDRSP